MTHPLASARLLSTALAIAALGCGGSSSTTTTGASTETSTETTGTTGSEASEEEEDSDGFALSESTDAGSAHGENPSEITATRTEAAMRLFVVDHEDAPLPGVVIKLTGPDGEIYYTDETDSLGYAEVLVPVNARYDLEYLSLGRRSAEAHVEVPEGPNQDIRLTLRYRRHRSTPAASTAPAATPPEEHLVLDGVLFESGSANLDPESAPRLDRVVEYMTHRPNVRVRIGGHTDNVGNPARNLTLSEERAEAVRDYLVAHGIAAGRIEAVGYGDTMPRSSNDTEAGRTENRRIEATEL